MPSVGRGGPEEGACPAWVGVVLDLGSWNTCIQVSFHTRCLGHIERGVPTNERMNK